MGAPLYQVSTHLLAKTALAQFTLPRAVVAITALGFIVPIAASLVVTVGAAFGHLPALDAYGPNLLAWAALAQTAGLASAIKLALFTGAVAAVLAICLAFALVALFAGQSRTLARWMTPFLAIPHAALAVGLGFLLAPSGLIARAIAPALGWIHPPDFATVGDPFGWVLILGLVIKETPFLLLVILAALTQISLRQHAALGASLGYGRAAVWVKIVLPQIWPQVRLPFYVVLAYGVCVVDMAMILGPSNPPTLAVLVTRTFADTDARALLTASAGAVLITLLVAGVAALAYGAERVCARLALAAIRRGARGAALDLPLAFAAWLGIGLLVLGAFAMGALGLWSVAWRWPWPLLLPEIWTLASWTGNIAVWAQPLQNTAIIAAGSTVMAMVLAILWLESADRAGKGNTGISTLILYLPLLVPQLAFLFGLNVLALSLGASGTIFAVIWAHSLFVFPYVMIALSGSWQALDPRFARSASSLGAGPWRVLFGVKLPMLLAPICTAAAIGVAVSIAQYLPTLFLGAGRIATLTTEAVTLTSSSNRRVTAVLASLQAILPAAAYAAALLIPMWRHKNRRDLTGAAQR